MRFLYIGILTFILMQTQIYKITANLLSVMINNEDKTRKRSIGVFKERLYTHTTSNTRRVVNNDMDFRRVRSNVEGTLL
jgi:hypothetical protein